MGQWQIGYPEGLDVVGSWAAGEALYAPWSIEAITFDTTTPERFGGKVTAIAETILTDTGSFTANQFDGGFIKITSGTAKGYVYKVTLTAANTLTCNGVTMVSDGVSVNDYYEVITGSSSFTFPGTRSPSRLDYQRTFLGSNERLPYYDGGIDIPIGMEPDDFSIMVFLTKAQFTPLEILLNTHLSYDATEAQYNSTDKAPLILETGTHDAPNQFLVNCRDYKIVKDGNFGASRIEVRIHFSYTGLGSYRGI